ncbi:2Fe-2S iron-sulfur cluster-binding protein [Peribacillus sp. Hz7]|uniref:2Fe-2S iron-sulfur cluster-binding protein n=1 Tax=Peribacillus sp. Hz7 TaxID=3344873 RepID=UPI0035CB0498
MVSMNKRAWTVGSLIPGSIIQKRTIQKQLVKPDSSGRQICSRNNIIVQQHENRFEIQPAEGKLLDVALNQGKALQYKCRKGTCGLCTVKIIEDGPGLSEPNEKEQKKLKKTLNNGLRLACQAEIPLLEKQTYLPNGESRCT